jgi:hypothetical protein
MPAISVKEYGEQVWLESLPIKLQNLPQRRKRYLLAATYLTAMSVTFGVAYWWYDNNCRKIYTVLPRAGLDRTFDDLRNAANPPYECQALPRTTQLQQQIVYFVTYDYSVSGQCSCDDTCIYAFDGECDDGGTDSDTSICSVGTDCYDCGMRCGSSSSSRSSSSSSSSSSGTCSTSGSSSSDDSALCSGFAAAQTAAENKHMWCQGNNTGSGLCTCYNDFLDFLHTYDGSCSSNNYNTMYIGEYEDFAFEECSSYNFTYDYRRRRRLSSGGSHQPTVSSAFACVVNDDIYKTEADAQNAYPTAAHPGTSLWKDGSIGLKSSCQAVEDAFAAQLALPAAGKGALGPSCPTGYSSFGKKCIATCNTSAHGYIKIIEEVDTKVQQRVPGSQTYESIPTTAYKFFVATQGSTLTSNELHTTAAATSFYTMTCAQVDPTVSVKQQLHTRAFYQTDGCDAFVARTDPDTTFDRCTKDVCNYWATSASNAWAFATAIDVCLIVCLIMFYNCSEAFSPSGEDGKPVLSDGNGKEGRAALAAASGAAVHKKDVAKAVV